MLWTRRVHPALQEYFETQLDRDKPGTLKNYNLLLDRLEAVGAEVYRTTAIPRPTEYTDEAHMGVHAAEKYMQDLVALCKKH